MGSIQFPVAKRCCSDLIAQIIIEILRTAQDVLPFSSHVKVSHRFPIFIDNEFLLIRSKGICLFFH